MIDPDKEYQKTCFDCKHSSIDPGHPGSFDPRFGGDPPLTPEANCIHTLAYKTQTDDMIVGDGEAKYCPHFHERIIKCVVCGNYMLITERLESSYGGACCSVKCYDIELEKEGWLECH